MGMVLVPRRDGIVIWGTAMLSIKSRDGQCFLASATRDNIVRLRFFSELAGSLTTDAFVVASGPSVNNFPFDNYRNHPFIAMNGSILACDKHGIRPYFYICDDESFAKDRAEIALLGLKRAEHIGMSFAVLCRLYAVDPGCLKGLSVFLLQRANRFLDRPNLSHRAFAWSIRKDPDLHSSFSIFSASRNRIGFSMNLDKGYFVARTIPYVALQLCYQLGCPRAFMLGVDMNPTEGRFYESGEGAAPSDIDGSFKKIILPSFKFLRQKIIKEGVFEVYNLSAESRIPSEVIDKIDLDTLGGMLKR